jgi:hypothetical protein
LYYKWMFRSYSCQLIGSFITLDTPVTKHLYQLNSVVFSQFHKGCTAVPHQF